jgi:ParB-like chromosome segregation protein Spo0J
MGLTTKRVPLSELFEDPGNARAHDERNGATIRGSLAEFGQQEPLVVTVDGMVVDGNETLRQMRALGWKECDVVVTDLDGAERAAYGIAANRTAEHGSWDPEALGQNLRAVEEFDAALARATGFDDVETRGLLDDWRAASDEPERREAAERPKERVTIKVEKIRAEDRDEVLEMVRRALEGTGYDCAAY